MNRRLFAMAATLALSAPAWAQEPPPPQKGAVVKEPAANDNGDTGEAANAGPDEGASPQVDETHTVVKGDTLWDLSQKYLGNPWYWPKVWSYNPQIANPHWIYPGDQVRFFSGGGADDQEAPTQVEPTAQGGAAGSEPEDEAELKEPSEAPDFAVGTGDADSGDDQEVVAGTRKIGYVPPKTSSFRQDGFVTQRELEESGQIVKSFSEQEMLDTYEKIYVRFKSLSEVKPGDRFFIYQTVREIVHPLTGKKFGYLTHIVGTAKIVGLDQRVATAEIDHAYDVVERGFYLAPYSDKLSKAVPLKPASAEVRGIVLDSLSHLGELGESMVVFVDKGKRDGLEEGNVLDIVRRGDGSLTASLHPTEPGFEDPSLPQEVIGRLLVVDAKDEAATCLTLRSMREFYPGDRFVTEMPQAKGTPVSER